MNPTGPDLFSTLENDLQRSLRPVQPNPEFVNRLHTRLVNPNTTLLERHAPQAVTAPAFFLVGFGLAVGLLLIWGIRQIR
jgi:hypothetical protein